MKAAPVIVFTLLLAGCNSTRQVASLNEEQAKTVAVQLANERAFKQYQCQPFRDSESAQVVAGQWIWVGYQGFGKGDLQATVELAIDGSTNKVDLQLLYNQVPL